MLTLSTRGNIVKLLAVGEVEGLPYFAMEYLPGGSLAQALELFLQLLQEPGADPEADDKVAYATLQLANGMHLIKEHDKAIHACRQAVRVLKRLSEAYPERNEYRFD